MKTKSILIGGLLTACMIITITSCYKAKDDYNEAGTNYNENSYTSNSYTIKMHNCSHSSTTLTIDKNSTVTWMNDDNEVHSIAAIDGSFNSGDIAIGSSYSRLFTSAGTIKYYDKFNSSITGVIVVTGGN